MKKKTQEEFLEEAIEEHGDTYDYSESVYTTIDSKVKIGCKKGHGFFWQVAYNHLQGNGCRKCHFESMSIYLEVGEFIKKATKKHGDRYLYDRAKGISNSNDKVEIGCKKHGYFWQRARTHFLGGHCKKCAVEERAKNNILSTDEFIGQCLALNGGVLFNYDRADYHGWKKPVEIGCEKHGYFWQEAGLHLKNLRRNTRGCPTCLKIWKMMPFRDIPTTLYYVKVTDLDDNVFWKVGITTAGVETRFEKMLDHIEILWVKEFPTGKKAWLLEQLILFEYSEYRPCKKLKGMRNIGYTELFDKDVMPVLDESILTQP